MFKNILIATAIFGITIGILVWADYADEKRSEAWNKYNECVKRETGMTAMQFYQLTGERLECNE